MGVTGSKQVTRPARSTGWSTITRMESMNLSGHETKVEPWWRRLLWPELTNVEDCQLAAKTGSTFAYVVAGMTAAMSFILAPDAATQIGIIVEGILIAATRLRHLQDVSCLRGRGARDLRGRANRAEELQCPVVFHHRCLRVVRARLLPVPQASNHTSATSG